MRTRHHLENTQNFLRDDRLARELVRKAALSQTDDVIDIGAGDGILTDALASAAGTVFAVELDDRYVEQLRKRFHDRPNVVVFAADALLFPLPATPYKVFANIPYRWTSAIVARLTSGTSPSVDSWLVVQREAAERFLPAKTSTMVAIQLYPWFDVSIEHEFRRADFSPRPRVDSVLMRIRQRPDPLLPMDDRERFHDLVAAVFNAWKPTAADALRALMPRQACDRLDSALVSSLQVRPGGVRPDVWLRMYREARQIAGAKFWRAVRRSAMKLRERQGSIERPTRTPVRR